MTVIIGLLGPAGAGKSSVATHLVENYGATRYSLASPLKEIAMRTLDLTPEQVWGTQQQKETVDPRYGFTPRWFLQRLGTEGCRAVLGDSVWTDACLARITREAPRVAVIEDVRFVNEALAVTLAGYGNEAVTSSSVWRMESPARETSADATHASEAEWVLAKYDQLIRPEKRGLDELSALVDATCARMGLVRWSHA